jgi:endo-1,4-beta-xylanase
MTLKRILPAALLVTLAASVLPAQTTMKDAYKDIFYIGAALNPRQFGEQDAAGAAIVKAQFSSISPENDLKWSNVHPQPDTYNWGPADKYVEFGEKNHMYIVGHCLVWHSQVPQWVFQGENGAPLTRDQLLARMREHIMTVVGRYKGRIKSWDVVNEALNEDGTRRQSQWERIIGDDFILKAFQYAHEADPQAELNYNDYSLENNEAKRKGALALVADLKAKGAPITTVGIQGHDNLDSPTLQEMDDTIAQFKALGVKVAITELDIDVLPAANNRPMTADISATTQGNANSDPYKAGLPDDVQKKLAQRYADLFAVYAKYKGTLDRVTLWGVTDGDSWKNNFPVRGRTNYPLLFDREHKAKPAVDAIIKVVRK